MEEQNLGWIKLHRRMLDWEWYDDPNVFRVWVHILLSVSHSPRRYRGRDIAAGSMIAGRNDLAEQVGLSVQKLRTALEKLASTGEITITPTAKYSIISVVKWDEYQANNQQVTSYQPASNHQPTSNQPATNQQVTTIQECKKERREEDSGAGIVRFPGGHSMVSGSASLSPAQIASAQAERGKQVDACRDILVEFGYDWNAFETNGGHYAPMVDLLEAGVSLDALRKAAGRCGSPQKIAGPPAYIAKVYRQNAAMIADELKVDPQKQALGQAITAWQKAGKVGAVPRLEDFDKAGNAIRRVANDA